MSFIKDNWRILSVLGITLFAFFNFLNFKTPSELGEKDQVIYKSDFINIITNLQLGLDLVGGAQFEFEAKTTEQVPKIDEQVMRGLVKVFENRVNASGTTEAVVQQVGKKRVLVEVPGADPSAVKRRLLATANLVFTELNEETNEWKATGITGADLKRAQAVTDGTGGWAISFELKPDAAKRFGQLTTRLLNKPLGIQLDGNIISAPTVRSPITAGNGEITGNFTVEEAQDLAVQLNAGALPVPVKILQERSIGATLGKESVVKSLNAGGLGFLLVILFMLVFYRVPGIIAAGALTAYVLLALAIYQEAVTLTLAGIAGFILSIGMAVDANILIFERAKEEIRAGKSVFLGFQDGFERAYTSIFDSNMNTSMVCLILIMFGTGLVKGFAVTLLIGVIVSLFSSLFITKTLLFWFIKTFNLRKI